jgi:predicted oxidoreductase
MWHYTEGIQNWNPVWPMHDIRILPGPSSLWLDAKGNRFPTPNFPGYDYSWFILTQKIIENSIKKS